jgi:hypothetical protein
MTGTDLCVNKPHKSRSYLNHLVHMYVRKYVHYTCMYIHSTDVYTYYVYIRVFIYV